MRRHAAPLETLSVEVPDAAVEAYEAALGTVCATVGFFLADEARGTWRVEGVHDAGADQQQGVTEGVELQRAGEGSGSRNADSGGRCGPVSRRTAVATCP